MMVLFALSIHRAEDERVFFQQMETLNRHGFQTSVVSLIDDGLMNGTFSLNAESLRARTTASLRTTRPARKDLRTRPWNSTR